MRPIRFRCTTRLKIPRSHIFDGVADIDSWPSFTGYGPLPGVKQASFVHRTDNMIGSVIQVSNTDESTHREVIREWVPAEIIGLELNQFSPPLARIADSFYETWTFAESPDGTLIHRDMALYPHRSLYRPFLWLISHMLKAALSRHLRQIAGS